MNRTIIKRKKGLHKLCIGRKFHIAAKFYEAHISSPWENVIVVCC